MKLIIYRLYWPSQKRKRAFDLVFTEQESVLHATIAPIMTGEEVTGFLSIIHKDGSNEDLRRMIVLCVQHWSLPLRLITTGCKDTDNA